MVNIISISDIHLGKNRILPNAIPNRLRMFLYPELIKELDVLFLVGDLTDGDLSMSSTASHETLKLIDELIELAVQNDFLIRIVQGTFSHDKHQLNCFNTRKPVFNKHNEEVVKVFKSIDIEFIKSLDMSVMYIPDDLPTKDIMSDVRTCLDNNSVRQVDVMLHHGYFEHLLPRGMPHMPTNTLNENLIKKLVKGIVLNGHIHTSSVTQTVLNNGSFDRLAHNEEESKGFFKLSLDTKNSKCEYKFIENTKATLFHTINLIRFKDDFDKALDEFKKQLDETAKKADGEIFFIRIFSDNVLVRHSAIEYATETYANVKMSIKKSKTREVDKAIADLHELAGLPEINENNLPPRIAEYSKSCDVVLELQYIMDKLRD